MLPHPQRLPTLKTWHAAVYPSSALSMRSEQLEPYICRRQCQLESLFVVLLYRTNQTPFFVTRVEPVASVHLGVVSCSKLLRCRPRWALVGSSAVPVALFLPLAPQDTLDGPVKPTRDTANKSTTKAVPLVLVGQFVVDLLDHWLQAVLLNDANLRNAVRSFAADSKPSSRVDLERAGSGN